MEEDLGVKVTRLRRRMSVESDDVKSPSTPSTPTKKRGGRLAAKPQLELINENALENVPKRVTRKSVSKDIVEPLDEKPVTPSRRSARIRSNTSIVSETTQSYDSPRAKRAARRISQVGSDNEAPVTPSRPTRRTRKDSTSSLDKQAGTVPSEKITAHVAEVISEETEAVPKETNNTNNDDKSSHNTSIARKSPRLQKKDNKKNDSKTVNEINDSQTRGDITLNTSNTNDNSTTNKAIQDTKSATLSPLDMKENTPTEKHSISISNLLNELKTDSKVVKIVLNKTDSAIEVVQSKRHRTHSWTNIGVATTNNNSFYSDSETSKNKNKRKDKFFTLNKLGGGDGLLNNVSRGGKKEIEGEKEEILKQKNRKDNSIAGDSKESIPLLNRSGERNKSTAKHDISIENNKENILHAKSQNESDSMEIAMLLGQNPAKDMQPLVYIEDSDSNTGSMGKPSMVTIGDGEDQCVPVADHPLQIVESSSSKGLEKNDSYIPMDIDETIPENVSVTNFTSKNNSRDEEDEGSHFKQDLSSLSSVQINKDASEASKKSDRNSILHNMEMSSNENKSTLIISQIKDVSSTEINSTSKSPKGSNNYNLSKSINIPDVAKEKDDKQNVSVNYSTSTPLQQKAIRKIEMQINTSNIIHNKDTKTELKENKSTPKKVSIVSKSSENSDSSEEDEQAIENTLKNKRNFIDDEVEEASDDYESGDSRNDDEKQYEKENEIIHKGETLDSDEDFTDDTDYEKDSFVVSSDEEDEDLLSGSGDDLSMSNNELTMSAKSKKKYNDRKRKEQTKASKEMYNARHKLNDSDKSSKVATSKNKKSKPQRFDSSSLDSEEEETVKTKNINHHRILDSSVDNSDVDESIGRKKKKSKRLSESLCEDSAANEKEITVCNNSVLEKNDPLIVAIKLEPKTPLKGLNISTVHVTSREEVEEMEIDENVSVMQPNETSDPLQATMQCDDSSNSSDHLEIIENYDSVLNNLNSDNGKQIKSLDISLNLNKKTKQKVSEPIIDQLNLTETKKSKKVKNISTEGNIDIHELKKNQEMEKATKNSKNIIQENENEESSDSIDMRLLFPEDSNDSEANGDKFKQQSKDTNSPVKDFIPLKRTVAKTNISENIDTNASADDSLLNGAKQKNNKRKSSQCSPEKKISTNKEPESNINFFIDTTGSLFGSDTSVNTTQLTHSSKKNNISHNKNLEVEETPVETVYHSKKEKKNSISDTKNLDVEEMPLNIECHSEKKKKNKKISISDNKDVDVDEASVEVECHSEKKKKNNKIRMSDNKDEDVEETPVDIECCSEKKKKNKKISISDNNGMDVDKASVEVECHSENKKKNKKISISDLEVAEVPVEAERHSEKKNKNKKSKKTLDDSEAQIENIDIQQENDVNFFIDTTGAQLDLDTSMTTTLKNSTSNKKKKYKNNSFSDNKDLSHEEAPVEMHGHSNKKNKKNTTLDGAQNNFETPGNESDEAPTEVSYRSEKYKKSRSTVDITQINTAGDVTVGEVSVDIVDHSGEKKKYKKSENLESNEIIQIDETDGIRDISMNTSLITNSIEKKKKKRKKTLSQSLNLSTDKGGHIEASHNTSLDSVMKQKHKNTSEDPVTDKPSMVKSEQKEGIRSKNRKRKSSADPPVEKIIEDVDNTIHTFNSNLNSGRQSKSRKMLNKNEDLTADFISAGVEIDNLHVTQKIEQQTITRKVKKNKKNKTQDNTEKIEEATVKQNVNKKRKEREDDNTGKKSKVLKENSFDKIHVPRLPAFILNQLEEKPKKGFVEAKKSKPISTTQFVVETTKKRKNKPSNYLEESVYLNDSPVVNKEKGALKRPKVLPFIPTASTSESGYTSNFRINVIPQETSFIAQSSNVTNFKNNYLQDKRIKKLGTLERYKKHRNMKISKF